MRLSQEELQNVRDHTDIVELISTYTKLHKVGSSYLGACPFHREVSQSLAVNKEAGLYHCFGLNDDGEPCGGGNVFSFVSRVEKISFHQAARKLAAIGHDKAEG